MPTNPSPAARTIRTELIAHGWLNIEDHGAVHKLIDQALAEERRAGDEMARWVQCAATECGGNGDIYEIRRLVDLSLHEAIHYRAARGQQ